VLRALVPHLHRLELPTNGGASVGRAAPGPVPVQMWHGVSPASGGDVAATRQPCIARRSAHRTRRECTERVDGAAQESSSDWAASLGSLRLGSHGCNGMARRSASSGRIWTAFQRPSPTSASSPRHVRHPRLGPPLSTSALGLGPPLSTSALGLGPPLSASALGLGPPPSTSAPGWAHPRPHLLQGLPARAHTLLSGLTIRCSRDAAWYPRVTSGPRESAA
jgi:hypothetical protein